jgi:sulfite reductase (ferredoxin)
LPGTDTEGIASSRGLARELRTRLGEKSLELDAAVKNLRIKVSGCFNSCGQHHIADIGFYGINRNVKGFQVPHFQVVLGGKFHDNAGEYGVPIGAVPSKRIPEAVLSITEYYVRRRAKDERFQDFVARIGKKAVKDLLEAHQDSRAGVDRSYYTDWGDPREFTLADMGVGECAGEVVSQAEFALAASERELFEAQLLLDDGRSQDAVKAAYASMLHAAQGLVKSQDRRLEDENQIIVEFTRRFYDTQLFWDKYAGGNSPNTSQGEGFCQKVKLRTATVPSICRNRSFIDAARLPQPPARHGSNAVKIENAHKRARDRLKMSRKIEIKFFAVEREPCRWRHSSICSTVGFSPATASTTT